MVMNASLSLIAAASVALAASWAIGSVFFLFLEHRRGLVHDYRLAVLDDDEWSVTERNRRYERLPTYGRMVWQVWRTDWDDYLSPPDAPHPR